MYFYHKNPALGSTIISQKLLLLELLANGILMLECALLLLLLTIDAELNVFLRPPKLKESVLRLPLHGMHPNNRIVRKWKDILKPPDAPQHGKSRHEIVMISLPLTESPTP